MRVRLSADTSSAVRVARLASQQTTLVLAIGGALAGVIGGLAMAGVGALFAVSLGHDVWYTAKQISSLVFGHSVLDQPGMAAGPVIVGSIIHLLLSAIFGAVYAVLSCKVLKLTTSYGAPMIGGMVYALAIWLLAYYLALPILDPTLLAIYSPLFIIQNIVFGTVLGLSYGALRGENHWEYTTARTTAPAPGSE